MIFYSIKHRYTAMNRTARRNKGNVNLFHTQCRILVHDSKAKPEFSLTCCTPVKRKVNNTGLQPGAVPAGRYLRKVELMYLLALLLYRLAISITALWNSRARAWRQGRAGQWHHIMKALEHAGDRRRIWMHCASLGEFEQGRPVLEALRQTHRNAFIVLTFFSPSGYEVRKYWDGADFICYLPMDGPRAARRFVKIVQPSLALFVKYEFWHFYLKELSRQKVFTVLVSGAFRKGQPFFRLWGGFFRKILSRFNLLTVQDKNSLRLLERIGLGTKAVLTGDTRYDRVAEIALAAVDFQMIEQFRDGDKLIIAGSTWPTDERMLKACVPLLPVGWKLIVAPHEINPAHLQEIKTQFGETSIFYSNYQAGISAKVLVIDNIGMLSSLYRYGEIACVGGGFSKSGIHNVLEPAVFGLPVVMGPEYQKFSEAVGLVKKGFAFPAKDEAAYLDILQNLISDHEGRESLQGFIKIYIQEHTGATAKILARLSQAL